MQNVQVEEPIAQESTVQVDAAAPAPGTLLSDGENQLMLAVEKNQVRKVHQILSEFEGIDLNCINALGQTPLHVAVDKESPEMMRLLLENGADVGDSLLQAVSRESLESVRLLLEFEENTSSSLEERKPITSFSRYYLINPLILAAQNNSYEIVKLLLKKGYFIDDSQLHVRACDCEECESKGRLGCSLRRLNVYRGLASPVYLSLSYLLQHGRSETSPVDQTNQQSATADPVLEALVLKNKLQEVANNEYEFREEYLKLSEQCENFSISLLEQCRDMNEIREFMSVPGVKDMKYVQVRGHYHSQAKELSVLNFAIKTNNRKPPRVYIFGTDVVAGSVIYSGFRQWEHYGAVKKAFFVFGYTILLPLWSLLYIFCPSKLSRLLTVPLLKFVGHTGSFCLFLLLLTLSSVQDIFFNPLRATFLDYLLILWILGQFLQEVKECYLQGKERYFSQWWNLITIMMLLLFFVSGVFWIAGYALAVTEEGSWAISFRQFLGVSAGKYQSYRLILLSNSCFAIAYLLAFLHFTNTMQVNAIMGPLQLSLVKMMRDIVKFLFLFVFIYFAFTLALRKVYSQYVWARKSFLNQTTSSPHGFSSLYGSMRLTFWAVFDKTELSSFETDPTFPTKITENTGEVLFALFNITIILVAINMLIAMMTNSFQSVENDSDVHWKFSRTQMWMQFIDKGSTLPPPFNIIPTPEDIAHWLKCSKLCPCCRSLECQTFRYHIEMNDVTSKSEVNSHERNQVIKHLIQRHFYELKKDQDRSEENQHLKDLPTRLGVVMSRLDKDSKEGALPPGYDKEVDDILQLWNVYQNRCFEQE